MAEKTGYTEVELGEFRSIIIAKKEEAERLAAGFKKEADDIFLSPVGFKTIEEASDSEIKKDLINNQARQLSFISHLNYALMRIENNHYGYCCDCGVLIPKGRLMATPHSTHCCSCK